MIKSNLLRAFVLVMFAAPVAACKTTQAPAPVRAPEPAAIYVPAPTSAPVPAPAPPPVYVAPDYTTLPGHSSVTTPVPVEPVEVDEMGPVVTQ